jgi:hypothetical protein
MARPSNEESVIGSPWSQQGGEPTVVIRIDQLADLRLLAKGLVEVVGSAD